MIYGIFHYLTAGNYHHRSCLMWFKSESTAKHKAQQMMRADDSLHLVVRSFLFNAETKETAKRIH